MHFSSRVAHRLRGASALILVFLVIEFVDEFAFGAKEAALPIIRTDLGLSYDQIGLLLTVPALLATLLFEPVLGVLGDVWKRRVLILGGGVGFALASFMVAGSESFVALLLAMILFYPSSGAFVSLSQSTLMDIEPERHEYNMARWTFAGSVGVVAGALVVGVFITAGLGWRGFYVLVGALALAAMLALWRLPFPKRESEEEDQPNLLASLRDGFAEAWQAMRRREVVRWMLLLEASDLMLDVLHGYLALYFVDVVGVDAAQAGFAVAVWTGVGLIGDFAMIPLLNRVSGVAYLRFSAAMELVLYSAFLLVPGLVPKLILIAVIGFFNAGWYAILQGNLYTVMPGQSGSVLTVSTFFRLISVFAPLLIGLLAERIGLQSAMVFPLLGCAALLIGLPRRTHTIAVETDDDVDNQGE